MTFTETFEDLERKHGWTAEESQDILGLFAIVGARAIRALIADRPEMHEHFVDESRA